METLIKLLLGKPCMKVITELVAEVVAHRVKNTLQEINRKFRHGEIVKLEIDGNDVGYATRRITLVSKEFWKMPPEIKTDKRRFRFHNGKVTFLGRTRKINCNL